MNSAGVLGQFALWVTSIPAFCQMAELTTMPLTLPKVASP